MLEKIKSPSDIRGLTSGELADLCGEIRRELIAVISRNGGHLASNLGAVELTVAIHRKFDSPRDKIIFDVGHQSYTHKLLTGRYDRFSTVRTEGGLSGFTRPAESEHDIFVSGHSSTSISQGFGLAVSNLLDESDDYVVAVIGDGALSGGLAYEALNNAGRRRSNLIVVLNDNKMSISRNVGAMARHLAVIRSHPSYFHLKSRVERILLRIPLIGRPLRNAFYWLKKHLKNLFYHSTIFEDMGFAYIGPVDGHDLQKLEDSMETARQMKRPVLLHVCTVKGKGYSFAERAPGSYHGVSSGMDVTTGTCRESADSFSSRFGEELCRLASGDERVCAITAAMADGTGLTEFSKSFPERFFDVGIAEEHAVTFASGLARGGKIPVVALYSTFLQRSFDQIIHDVAIQGLKVILCVDRAGFVGEDGETHQGLFDVSFLGAIPGITVFSPATFDELAETLDYAVESLSGPCVIRYPKGRETTEQPILPAFVPEGYRVFGKGGDTAIVTFGRLLGGALAAAGRLTDEGNSADVLCLNQIKPIPPGALKKTMGYRRIFFFEEGMKTGGLSEHFACELIAAGYDGKIRITAVDDGFVPQSAISACLRKYRLDGDGIYSTIIGA